MHERGPLLLQLVQVLRAVGSGRGLLNHLAAPRDPPPVPLAILGQVREARLEALEQGIAVVFVGDLSQQIVGKVGEGPGLDLGGRELGADQVGRSGLGHGEHTPLDTGPLQLLVHLGHSALVVAPRGGISR